MNTLSATYCSGMTPPKKSTGSRQGMMQEGWYRQGLQLPESFRTRLREDAARYGSSSVKVLGTIGMGFILGLPEETRRSMLKAVSELLWDNPQGVPPEDVMHCIVESLAPMISEQVEEESGAHFDIRILDPAFLGKKSNPSESSKAG